MSLGRLGSGRHWLAPADGAGRAEAGCASSLKRTPLVFAPALAACLMITPASGSELCVGPWELGDFAAGRRFSSIDKREHIYNIPKNWKDLTAFAIPRKLSGDSDRHGGVEKLVLRFELEPGFYSFLVSFLEPERSTFCMVLFDGREIGCFGVPKLDVDGNSRPDVRKRSFPFICEAPGEHTISLVAKKGKRQQIWDTGFLINGLALKPYRIKPRQHSLKQEYPGRVALDAWGWHFSINYQRDSLIGVDYDYFKKKVIDESYRWGANLIECSVDIFPEPPSWKRWASKAGWVISWEEDDPIKGADHYIHRKHPFWDDNTFLNATRYAHDHGMLVQWFLCNPALKQEGRKLSKDVDLWLKLNLLRKIARDFSNLMRRPWRDALDGLDYEGWTPQARYGHLFENVKVNQRMWPYNPGLYLAECGKNSWTHAGRIPPVPNYIRATMCLNYEDRYRPGKSSSFMLGHDDKNPLRFYGTLHLQGKYGKQHMGYQIDCRAQKAPEFWKIYSRCSGGSHPDWIVKQCNDLFRPRARDSNDNYETAIWWLGQPDNISPGDVKRYVYAVSQDPVKCAIATSLAATGKGGSIDRKKEALPTGDTDAEILRNRSPYPAEITFIQNNYFRLYLHPDAEGGVLLYDLERLAHYDSNSLSIALTRDFITTVPAGETTNYQKRMENVEPAGYRAVVQADINLSGPQLELNEKRRFTFLSDSSYFQVRLERRSGSGPQAIRTLIGAEAYDRLAVDGGVLDAAYASSDVPGRVRLIDSSGLRPELVLFILDKGKLTSFRWKPHGKIVLESAAVDNEVIRLAFAVPEGLYVEEDLAVLHQVLLAMEEPEKQRPARTGPDGLKVTNPYRIPLVKVVELQSTGAPYMVKEYGWWMFRGAQPSLEKAGVDLLKVYLEPKGEVDIRPFGFLEGVVKPGWGCQYILALKGVRSDDKTSKCTAKVLSVTPLVFAPRVEFSRPAKSVKVNGKPWHYFDGNFVFLPNAPGEYEVEVSHGGKMEPHLLRTYALVAGTEWDGKTMTIITRLPVWSTGAPPELDFFAVLDPAGRAIEQTAGATVVEAGRPRALIRFKAGATLQILLKQPAEQRSGQEGLAYRRRSHDEDASGRRPAHRGLPHGARRNGCANGH